MVSDELEASPLGLLVGHRRGGLLSFVRAGSRWRVDARARFQQFQTFAPKLRLNELDGIAGKGFERFDVVDNVSDTQLRMVNTHLQSQYDDRSYKNIRNAQLQQIEATLKMASSTVVNPNIILAGDFNSTPSEMRKFLGKRWTDLTATLRNECDCSSSLDFIEQEDGKQLSLEGEWIDYVLVDGGANFIDQSKANLVRSTTVDCPYSDHQGIQIQLRLKP